MTPEIEALKPVLATMNDRVRACSDALLALRAGHSALDDVRAKLQHRLSTLKEDEAEKRSGLRESLAVVGNIMVNVQGQLPVCEGQATEARLTYASIASHMEQLAAGAPEPETLRKSAKDDSVAA